MFLLAALLCNYGRGKCLIDIGTEGSRLSSQETRVDARFNHMEVKFDTLIGKVIELGNRVTRIEAKLDLR